MSGNADPPDELPTEELLAAPLPATS